MSNLVSTQWLEAHLSDVRVVDASWYMPDEKRQPAKEFEAGHIPGAVFFDIDGIADHTSGLPAFMALWHVTATPGDVVARICIEPLRRPPGSAPDYSDLNAILLGAILEVAGGGALRRRDGDRLAPRLLRCRHRDIGPHQIGARSGVRLLQGMETLRSLLGQRHISAGHRTAADPDADLPGQRQFLHLLDRLQALDAGHAGPEGQLYLLRRPRDDEVSVLYEVTASGPGNGLASSGGIRLLEKRTGAAREYP